MCNCRRISELHGLEIDARDRTPVVFRALKVWARYFCRWRKLVGFSDVDCSLVALFIRESECVAEQGRVFRRSCRADQCWVEWAIGEDNVSTSGNSSYRVAERCSAFSAEHHRALLTGCRAVIQDLRAGVDALQVHSEASIAQNVRASLTLRACPRLPFALRVFSFVSWVCTHFAYHVSSLSVHRNTSSTSKVKWRHDFHGTSVPFDRISTGKRSNCAGTLTAVSTS